MKKFLLVSLLLSAAAAAAAAPVTAEAALARISAGGPAKAKAMATSRLRLASTVDGVYIFATDGGDYVLAPSDDAAPAVLGYGSGFVTGFIPPAFAGWISEYGRQIEHLAQNGVSRTATTDDKTPIPPLLATAWAQGAPYNGKCPLHYGRRSATGCVATAMAQIVNYHKWPETTGIGSHSYYWETGRQTLTFDYGTTVFDWVDMDDHYNAGSSSESCAAVATLMYACGVGVDMDYTSGESSASTFSVPAALVDYFGYDSGAAYMVRDYFSAEQWDDMVYAELAAGRPVFYGGRADYNAHAFVCDGYEGDGYFHINWGWSGSLNGAFLLSVLDPYENSESGASTGGYVFDQDMVIGIQRPVEGSVRALNLYADGPLQWSEENSSFCLGRTPDGAINGIYNYSPTTIDIDIALSFEDPAGNETIVPAGSKTLYFLDGIYYIYPEYPADFAAGAYKVKPVARLHGTDRWQKIYIPYGEPQYLTVTVTPDGKFEYSDPESGVPVPTTAHCYVDVHSINGTLLKHSVASSEARKDLPSGFYIIGGKKVAVE